MNLRISGKHMEIGDAFRSRIEGRIGEAIVKYFDGGFSGHVTVEKSGSRFSADCMIRLDPIHTAKGRPIALSLYFHSGQGVTFADFLDRTYDIVVPGGEALWMDFDDAVEHLLSNDLHG